MIIPQGKVYEKPVSGQYHAVLADVVDLGLVTTTFENRTTTQPMVRFIWILNVNGKDGKPLSVAQRFNATSMHEKSNIYKTLKQILGVAPHPTLDIDTLIGQTRYLWINTEIKPDNKEFSKVMGILPAQINPATGQQVVVQIPADFVREKFKPKTTTGPQGQSVQTYSQPPAQAAQQPLQNQQFQQPAPAGFQPLNQDQGSTIKF